MRRNENEIRNMAACLITVAGQYTARADLDWSRLLRQSLNKIDSIPGMRDASCVATLNSEMRTMHWLLHGQGTSFPLPGVIKTLRDYSRLDAMLHILDKNLRGEESLPLIEVAHPNLSLIVNDATFFSKEN